MENGFHLHESQGASFKPLNFCQQPTNVYISAATCCECLPLHQGELPSSFLAYLHRMWPPAERAEARKKQENKANNPTSKEETGLDETTTVGSYFTHIFPVLEWKFIRLFVWPLEPLFEIFKWNILHKI